MEVVTPITQPDLQVLNQKLDETDLTILLEQYKLYIESANLTTSLRSQANTFFATANTALVSFIAAIFEFSSQKSAPIWTIFACIAGVLLAISWFFSIKSYRALNSGRFAVINELETLLPARIYAREWELITGRSPLKRRYTRQTYVEQSIPIAFCILYVALAITMIIFGS